MLENYPQSEKLKFDDYQESPFWIFIEFFPNLTCFDGPQSDDDPKGTPRTKIPESDPKKNIIGEEVWKRKVKLYLSFLKSTFSIQ